MPPPSTPPPSNLTSTTPFSELDFEEQGFTELETVALASILTLIPLFLGLAFCYGVKYIWRSVRSWRKVDPKDAATPLDKDSLSDKTKSNYLLLPDEMKPSESQFSVIPAEEVEEALGSFSSSNQTSKSTANGSIITMTMKNNHLIVETEHRFPVEVGETKEEQKVFVVEGESNSTALVHHQPEEDDDQLVGASVGLSQSDLSGSTTSSQQNIATYGVQCEYTLERAAPNLHPPHEATSPSGEEGSCREEERRSERPVDLELRAQYDNPAYLPTPATAAS